MVICYGTPLGGRPALTIGNVIFTPNTRKTRLDAALYVHERNHAAQWAARGSRFALDYFNEWMFSRLFFGDECHIPSEVQANLQAGGYQC